MGRASLAFRWKGPWQKFGLGAGILIWHESPLKCATQPAIVNWEDSEMERRLLLTFLAAGLLILQGKTNLYLLSHWIRIWNSVVCKRLLEFETSEGTEILKQESLSREKGIKSFLCRVIWHTIMVNLSHRLHAVKTFFSTALQTLWYKSIFLLLYCKKSWKSDPK